METVEELKMEILRLKQELSETIDYCNQVERNSHVNSCNSDVYEKAYNDAQKDIDKLKEKMRLMKAREKQRLDKAYEEIQALKGGDPSMLTE